MAYIFGMRRANQTSFRSGHKRSQESIEKQRQTMIRQIKNGSRIPPKNAWSEKSIAKMVKSIRKTNIIKWPIGSRRKHNARGWVYWIIKIKPNGKWKYEHRFLMEKKIKRKLKRSEYVHHKNHNTLDNSMKNLELMSASEHSRYHGLSVNRKHK